ASEVSLFDSLRYAEDVTKRSGSSFRLSFFLLPKSQYRAMCVLYAYMRLTDDLADSLAFPGSAAPESASPDVSEINDFDLKEQKLAQLKQWREKTLDCLVSEKFQHPLHPALHHVCQTYNIEPDWLTSVITGAEFDQSTQTIQTYDDLKN